MEKAGVVKVKDKETGSVEYVSPDEVDFEKHLVMRTA